jgi:hypothetical protein
MQERLNYDQAYKHIFSCTNNHKFINYARC